MMPRKSKGSHVCWCWACSGVRKPPVKFKAKREALAMKEQLVDCDDPCCGACNWDWMDDIEDGRALDKQISRWEDERALATGEKTSAQLWAENTFLPALHTSIDFSKIRLPR